MHLVSEFGLSNKRIQQMRQVLDLVEGIGAQLKRKNVR